MPCRSRASVVCGAPGVMSAAAVFFALVFGMRGSGVERTPTAENNFGVAQFRRPHRTSFQSVPALIPPCTPMQSRVLIVLAALVASADCLALRAPTRHATRCGGPCMAAKKRAKQVTRREALSGGGFDSDAAYKDIANAGKRIACCCE